MTFIASERTKFSSVNDSIRFLQNQYPDYFFVPEGGANENGITGCKEMLSLVPNSNKYDIIVCAIGTGTTFKGIAASLLPHQQLIGIPVIKIKEEERMTFEQELSKGLSTTNYQLFFEYAGKGYAKKEPAVFEFMNWFYAATSIPTDFVYTAKLAKAVCSLYERDLFNTNQNILLIHSGGLQGNRSLPSGLLLF
jgi:1-aminocyclopropane-1-carboxylate deaminase